MYQWIKVVHVIGFLVWSGGLVACQALLRRQGKATGEARTVLGEVARKFALAMDIGAMTAIIAGLYLAVGFEFNAFKDGGWLHVKTTLVAVLLGVHGFSRVQVRKLRERPDATFPTIILLVTIALLAAIIIFATVKPMR